MVAAVVVIEFWRVWYTYIVKEQLGCENWGYRDRGYRDQCDVLLLITYFWAEKIYDWREYHAYKDKHFLINTS